MGGNVFDEARLTTAEWESIAAYVSRQLGGKFAPAVLEKDSHGDVDILVPGLVPSRDEIVALLEPRMAVLDIKHDSVLVYDTVTRRKAQVDLLASDPGSIHFSLFWHSWGGIGHLLGKIARSCGLRLSKEGLFYDVFHAKQKIGTVLVTDDIHVALRIMGYTGWIPTSFSCYDDLFGWVASSHFFSREMFYGGNSKQRKRQKKRTDYQRFLNWIETEQPKNGVCANMTSMVDRFYFAFILAGCPIDRINALHADVNAIIARHGLESEWRKIVGWQTVKNALGDDFDSYSPALIGRFIQYLRGLEEWSIDGQLWTAPLPEIHWRIAELFYTRWRWWG